MTVYIKRETRYIERRIFNTARGIGNIRRKIFNKAR